MRKNFFNIVPEQLRVYVSVCVIFYFENRKKWKLHRNVSALASSRFVIAIHTDIEQYRLLHNGSYYYKLMVWCVCVCAL